MKTRLIALVLPILTFSLWAWAQTPGPGSPRVRVRTHGGPGFGTRVVLRGEMGKWWRDPEISKKLQLSDGQVGQLDQIFYDHRVKLIDYGAEMEKQDLKLQTLLDADQPNEGEIGSQVDLVLAARGKLEREYTFMNLDLRKVLSLDQWRQLKSIRGARGAGDNVIYFQKKMIGPGPGAGPIELPFPPDIHGELPPPPEPNL